MGLLQHAAQVGVDQAGIGVQPAGPAVRLRPQDPQERGQELPHVLRSLPAQATAL